MRKIIPFVAILLTSGFMLLAPIATVEALDGDPTATVEAHGVIGEMRQGTDTTGMQGGKTANEIIKAVVNTLFFILGAVAVIMIIWSGIRYATSAGNATAITSAKNTLMYSVVGLIVAMLAYAIVDFIIDRLA